MAALTEDTGEGDPESRRQGVDRVALITAACLLGDSMLYVALPLRFQEVGLASLGEVGVVLSINRLARLPIHPLIAWAYQRIALRTGIALAVGLSAATTLAYGWIQGFWAWVAVRCAWGIAWTLLRQGGYLIALGASDPSDRGRVIGRYHGLSRLGSLVGVLGGGLLCDLHGLAVTARVLAVLPIAAIPALFLWSSRAPAGTPEPWPRPRPLPAPEAPALAWVLLSGGAVAMLFQGMIPATLSAVIDLRRAAEGRGAALFASTAAGGLLALRWAWEPWLAPLVGRVADGRIGPQSWLVRTLAAAALLFFVLSCDLPAPLGALVLLGLLLLATALTTITDALALHAAARGSQGRVTAAHALAQDLGAALGPSLGLWVLAAAGPATLYRASVVLLLPLSLWGWRASRRKARPSPGV